MVPDEGAVPAGRPGQDAARQEAGQGAVDEVSHEDTSHHMVEIAAARGLSVKAVEWRMSKALQHCVEQLDG